MAQIVKMEAQIVGGRSLMQGNGINHSPTQCHQSAASLSGAIRPGRCQCARFKSRSHAPVHHDSTFLSTKNLGYSLHPPNQQDVLRSIWPQSGSSASRRGIVRAVQTRERGSGGPPGDQQPAGPPGQGGDMSYLGMWKAARDRKEADRKRQDEEEIKARLEVEEARRNQVDPPDSLPAFRHYYVELF